MLAYICKRILAMIPTIIGISVLIFLTVRFIPGDPAVLLAGQDATPEVIASLRKQWGLDQPLPVQYFIYFEGLLHGDVGISIRSGRPVLTEISQRFPATLQLAVLSSVLALSIGLLLGIVSGIKPYSLYDGIAMSMSLIGVSAPAFWLGLLLMWLFAVELGWLPPVGTGGIEHLILPSITLSTFMVSSVARQTRSSLIEVMRQDYIRTARSKGASERVVVLRHALKNAMIPVVTVAGIQFGRMLGGAIIVETVFAYPGLGKLLIDSVFSRDYPVIQGCSLIFAISFALTNLFVDMIYAYLDPRIHYR
jgi:peptide/nickel transport system permease protein/oligopeptide transport system permease protein